MPRVSAEFETSIRAFEPAPAANTSAWYWRWRSLPAEPTMMRPGPVIAESPDSNALVPSCGPNWEPSDRLTTAFCPRWVARPKM
jgi:hypothetical protein